MPTKYTKEKDIKERKTIILIQPYLCFRYKKISQTKRIPISLLAISTFLHKKYEIIIIDQEHDSNWKVKLDEALLRNLLCVGITCTIGPQIKDALNVSKYVKSKKRTPIVWGGPHPTLFPKQTLKSKYIDFVVIGDGEITFPELVKAIENGSSLNAIKGIGFKEGDNIIINQKRERFDLNKAPFLPYHLLNPELYNNFSVAIIETSRGCPYGCTFCNNVSLGRSTWIAKTPERVVSEISFLLKNYPLIKEISTSDEEFSVDKSRVLKIFKLIKNKSIKINFNIISARIDNINKFSIDEIKFMEKAGLQSIWLGAESGSDRILKLLNKQISVKDIIEVNKKFRNTNIKLFYYFMCALPTESLSDIIKTVLLTIKLFIDNPRIIIAGMSIYSPLPLTKLTETYPCDFPKSLEGWASYGYDKINSYHKNSYKKYLYLLINRVRNIVGHVYFLFFYFLKNYLKNTLKKLGYDKSRG